MRVSAGYHRACGRRWIGGLGGVLVAVGGLSAGGGHAQDTAGSGSLLMDEIVVTAQKREQDIQQVGIAITAFSGEQLRRLGVEESTELALMVPGVHLSGSSGGQFVNFTIRGVAQNEFSDFAESPNAVYIDETYIAQLNNQRFGSFDLERVEVLKGPQGTLFGRNATGGLVHYVSRRPTEHTEGYLSLTYGRFNQVRAEGAIGGPLGDGLSARLAVLYNRFDEIYDNSFPGVDDEWNDNTVAGRLHLLWQPTDALSVLVTGYGNRTEQSTAPYQSFPSIAIFDGDGNVIRSERTGADETRAGIGPGGVNTCPGCFFGPTRPVPGGDAFGFIDPDGGGFRINKDFADDDGSEYGTYGATVRLEWSGPAFDVVSISDYKRTEKDVNFEVDNGPANQLLFPAFAESNQVSQEVRLSGGTERLRWVGGAYLLSWDLDPARTGFIFPAETGAGPNVLGPAFAGLFFQNSGTQKTLSYSGFGQVEYDLTPAVTAIVGARLIREEKEFTHRTDIRTFPGDDLVVANFNPASLQDLETGDTLWSGKVQLEWRPSDDLLLYAGINRGVKAGGFNQNLAGLPPVPPSFVYQEEVLLAYEAGFKATVLGGTTRINASVYYYDYDDYQAFQFFSLSNFVVNADAESYGGEIEIVSSPIDGLDLMVNAAYIDATVKDVPFASGPGGTQTVFLDREPAYTPDFQATALVRYQWPSLGGGTMAVQADASYSSDFFFFLTNYPNTRFGGYVVGNLQLSYASADDRWRAGAFVRNVGDARYQVVGFDLSTTCGCSVASYGKPRWWGLTATVTY